MIKDYPRLPVIYVGGPYRGPDAYAIHQNCNYAESLAYVVWQMGAVALCPHMNTRNFQGALPDHVWLQGDIELLCRCDALLLTDNYARSQGACAERDFAINSKLPVFYADIGGWQETLQSWIRKRRNALDRAAVDILRP